MKRFLGWSAAVLLVVVAGVGGWLYHKITTLGFEPVTRDVWMITGERTLEHLLARASEYRQDAAPVAGKAAGA